jgi:hypothetical protein
VYYRTDIHCSTVVRAFLSFLFPSLPPIFPLTLLPSPTLLPSNPPKQAPPPPTSKPLPRIRFKNSPKRTPHTINPLHTPIHHSTAIRRDRTSRKPTLVRLKPFMINSAHLHRLRRPVPYGQNCHPHGTGQWLNTPLHSPGSREVGLVLWYSTCGFSMVERGFLEVHKALG